MAIFVLEYSLWVPLVYTLVMTHLTVMAVTLYLHRSMAHGGVHFHPLIAFIMRFWLWFTTGIITREWVAVHRKHHSYAEREGDPHSPRLVGIFRVLFLGVLLYRRCARVPEVLEKYGKGTPDDWFEKHIFTPYSLTGPMILGLVDQLLFPGGVGLLIWVIQITWIPFWAAGVVNGLGHFMGYRNHVTNDDSHNLAPIGVLMGGEELHNNHHYDPKSPKLKYMGWEFDIGWVYIRLLQMFGFANVTYPGRDGQVLSRKARRLFQDLKQKTESVIEETVPAMTDDSAWIEQPWNV